MLVVFLLLALGDGSLLGHGGDKRVHHEGHQDGDHAQRHCEAVPNVINDIIIIIIIIVIGDV